jgi:hypothetical protein
MLSSKCNNFLNTIISYIKFPFDRNDIWNELENHMLDKIEYYTNEGYNKEEAEEKTINDMGDAKEIGERLNKEHNPIIGWLWKITNLLVIFFVAISVISYGSIFVSMFSDKPINEIDNSNIVYKIDVNKKVKLDDVIINFTNVVYEKNGDMNIIYEYYDTKLWGSGWSLGGLGTIMDDLGNTYFGGSSHQGGGFKSKCRQTVRNFSKEANTLIINYASYNRQYKVEINLKEGLNNE